VTAAFRPVLARIFHAALLSGPSEGIMLGMTPDAAGIVAQVDVGLLIALAVDARSSKDDAKSKHNDITNQ
jgi:hypothetical protein